MRKTIQKIGMIIVEYNEDIIFLTYLKYKAQISNAVNIRDNMIGLYSFIYK